MADLIATIPPGLVIDGERVESSDGQQIVVADPATGASIATIASASPDDALRAVGAAHSAAKSWRETAPRIRGEVLRKAFELMIERRDELAEVIVRESGKSWADAQGEVSYAAEFFRWYGEEAVRIAGTLMLAPNGDKQIIAAPRPIGVSVLVTPWNFPVAMITRKVGPALASGCTVVVKPASDTPLSALLLSGILDEAGCPPGVVNVVPSSRSSQTVGAMLGDPRVRKVSFTGSTEVGRMLLAQASEQVLKASMELGGNAPFVVMEDVDVDAAVEAALVAKMRNGGESCIAANRFLCHEAIADDFSSRLADRMRNLRMGPGMDRTNDVGPVINERALVDIAGLVDDSVGAGAKVLTGGAARPGQGWYYEPTVVTQVDHDDPILRKEIFGPVAPVTTFVDEDQAVELANDTEFGLAAYVFSGDLGRAMRIAESIDAGIVGINRGFVSDPAAPFGGMKQSGLGREGGHDGILEFMETQYIAAAW
ncbi:NAD-dependent succinate-semialdehyde dehydrogenase [Euzebya pacifica]|uniref:NAD-dependent succinate-semialdehyde dehydrogenase n=1 Tax=Euzebya pacifica TaxID=1608957 RepID=UPI0030F5099F